MAGISWSLCSKHDYVLIACNRSAMTLEKRKRQVIEDLDLTEKESKSGDFRRWFDNAK